MATIIVESQKQADSINEVNHKAWLESDAYSLGGTEPESVKVGDRVCILADGQSFKALENPRIPFTAADYKGDDYYLSEEFLNGE